MQIIPLFTQIKISCSRLTAVSTASFLIACGGTGQDDGSTSSTSQTFSGIAIDGYIARATVFIDTNNNGTRDSWEPFAFTDNDGYYSYNPRTNTDYCTESASAQEQQYCLISNIEYSNIVIRIDGGYDILTGEPFLGQMNRRVNAQNTSEITNTVISPFTSLLSDITDNTERSTLFSSLGIAESDLDVNYLNTDGNNSVDASLLSTSLKIHKVVTVLSDRLTDTYTELGENFATPNDASSALYPNLAEQIIQSANTLDTTLSNQTILTSVLDTTEELLRDIYERNELNLPNDMGNITSPGEFERIASVASKFSSVINTLIDTTDTNFNINDAKGSTNAIETLVIKTINETANDNSIDNAISFFTTSDGSNDNLIDALLTSLSLDSADINTLASNSFTGDDFDSVEDIINASSYPSDVEPFTIIGNKSLKISETINIDPNDLEDSEVELYFAGNATDIDGAFSACVKHIDGANSDGTLGEGNTRGELVDGFWSLLGASENNIESYSLLITITFLGSTYQGILKPAGTTTLNNVEQQRIRFDNNGELNYWLTQDGLIDTESVPLTHLECQERLPSRVGL